MFNHGSSFVKVGSTFVAKVASNSPDQYFAQWHKAGYSGVWNNYDTTARKPNFITGDKEYGSSAS